MLAKEVDDMIMLSPGAANTAKDTSADMRNAGRWHLIFSRYVLLIWAVAHIWTGATRTAGVFSFPFGNMPGHLTVLLLGLLECALGAWQLAVRRDLLSLKKGSLKKLWVSFAHCAVYYICRKVFFTVHFRLPMLVLSGRFWIWLAVLLAFFCFELLYSRKSGVEETEN